MYKLFFKIAFRYLLKNKLYSFINIAGLAIGIASFLLIMIYVSYEKSYDKFKGSESVYRVYMDSNESGNFEAADAQTSALIGPALTSEFPEVVDHTRLYRFDRVVFKLGEKVLTEFNGAMGDQSYLKMFNLSLLKGNSETALVNPNSIVLTESLAYKLFGTEDPINKTISVFYGEEVVLKITGILKDAEDNTHIKNNFVISFPTIFSWSNFNGQDEISWGQCNFHTYIKVNDNTNFTGLKSKVIASDFEDDPEERYNIEPIQDIHLYSNKPYEAQANGSISRIKFLSAIAFIILILSWLNYINLSTTKSLERAKEVGIRKVAGAQKHQLIIGSLVESFLLNIFAIVIAIGLAWSLLSYYNSISDIPLAVNSTLIKQNAIILAFIIFGVVLAGLYPAIVLSKYSPSKSLKGTVRSSASGIWVRKGLIVTQFLATIILIVGTLIVSKQINFLNEQPTGVNLNNIVSIQPDLLSNESDSIIRNKFESLAQELKQLPFINQVAKVSTFPGDGYDNLSSFIGVSFPNGKDDGATTFYSNLVQPEYFDVLDIKFLAGGPFIKNAQGQAREIIINEKSMLLMGITSPSEAVNKKVGFFGEDWIIRGVTENYHHFGLKTAILPMVNIYTHSSNNLLIKFDNSISSTNTYTKSIAQLKQKWFQFFPESTFNYIFLDKKYDAQYKDDQQFSAAFKIFTLLAIFIACLGLFGLTSYACIQRKKEIGVRKVNGASIGQIVSLLNKDFLILVGVAFILALPIAWLIMSEWLSNFAYKTTLSWWVFALAGLITLAIAFLTVSWQSIKAAIANPISALKEE